MKTLALILLLVVSVTSQAAAKDLFGDEINKAAGGVVAAWKAGDAKAMRNSYKDLVRYETYQLSIGKWSPDQSYLSQIPKEETDLGRIAAAIYMLKLLRDEGIDLRPRSFFENRTFEVQVQP